MAEPSATRAQSLAGVGFGLAAFFMLALAVPAPRAMAAVLPLALLPCLPLLWQERGQLFVKRGALIALVLAAFLLGGTLASPAPPDRALGFALSAAGMLLAGMLLWQVALLVPQALHSRIFKSLAAGSLCAALMILAEYLFGQPITGTLATLGGKPVPYLYVVDRSIIIASLMLWPLVAWHQPRWWVVGGLGVALVALLGFSSSQATQVGMLAATLVYIACWLRPREAGWLLRWGVFAGVLLAPLLVLLIDRLFAGQAEIWAAANGMARLVIWNNVTEAIWQRPWAGYGFEAMTGLPALGQNPHPHNGALQIWLEFGLAGAFLAAAAMVWLLRKAEGRPALQAAFAAWLTVFAVGYDIWQPWWMATGALLLAFCVLTLPRRPVQF